MKQNQENKLSMYERVDAHLTTNAAVVATRPALGTAQTALQSNISAIHAADMVKQTDIKGITHDKYEERQALAEIAFSVGAGVTAYANDISDQTLLEKVNYTLSELVKMNDQILPEVSQIINDEANAVIASLGTYGVDAANLTDLLAKRQAFIDSIPKHPNAVAGKKTNTALLRELFRNTDKLLKRTMDKIVKTLKSSEPMFVSDYFNSRVIYDLGHNTAGNGASTIVIVQVRHDGGLTDVLPADVQLTNTSLVRRPLDDEGNVQFASVHIPALVNINVGSLNLGSHDFMNQPVVTGTTNTITVDI